jgi:hypothetical protein
METLHAVEETRGKEMIDNCTTDVTPFAVSSMITTVAVAATGQDNDDRRHASYIEKKLK